MTTPEPTTTTDPVCGMTVDIEQARAKGLTAEHEGILPALWAAADDSGRRLLTEALFQKVEVLGVKSVTIHPTPEADAHGWSEAFGPTPQLIPVEMVADAIGTDGRGERGRASLAHLRSRPRFVLENVTPVGRIWRVAERKAG